MLSRSGRGRQSSTSEIPERSGAPAAELTRHRCSLVGCGPGWASLVSEASELQGVHSSPRRGALNSGSAESPSRTRSQRGCMGSLCQRRGTRDAKSPRVTRADPRGSSHRESRRHRATAKTPLYLPRAGSPPNATPHPTHRVPWTGRVPWLPTDSVTPLMRSFTRLSVCRGAGAGVGVTPWPCGDFCTNFALH